MLSGYLITVAGWSSMMVATSATAAKQPQLQAELSRSPTTALRLFGAGRRILGASHSTSTDAKASGLPCFSSLSRSLDMKTVKRPFPGSVRGSPIPGLTRRRTKSAELTRPCSLAPQYSANAVSQKTPSMAYKTSQDHLLDFVREHQVVAESAKGLPVPSLVRFMVGADYRGNWWSLENSSSLYNALQDLRDLDEIHVCKLAKGKVTLVHTDALLPLVSLQRCLPAGALDGVVEVHQAGGKHQTIVIPMSDWWPVSAAFSPTLLSESSALQRLDSLSPGLGGIVRRLFA